MPKKPSKNHFSVLFGNFRPVFFFINPIFFNILQNGPLFVTFEVTALVGKRCFLKNQINFAYLYTEATAELQKLGKL